MTSERSEAGCFDALATHGLDLASPARRSPGRPALVGFGIVRSAISFAAARSPLGSRGAQLIDRGALLGCDLRLRHRLAALDQRFGIGRRPWRRSLRPRAWRARSSPRLPCRLPSPWPDIRPSVPRRPCEAIPPRRAGRGSRRSSCPALRPIAAGTFFQIMIAKTTSIASATHHGRESERDRLSSAPCSRRRLRCARLRGSAMASCLGEPRAPAAFASTLMPATLPTISWVSSAATASISASARPAFARIFSSALLDLGLDRRVGLGDRLPRSPGRRLLGFGGQLRRPRPGFRPSARDRPPRLVGCGTGLLRPPRGPRRSAFRAARRSTGSSAACRGR